MKNSLILTTAALSVLHAAGLHIRDSETPSVLALDIQRQQNTNPLARDRRRRKRDTISENLDNEETLYFANITLGTPKQSLRLHIDTGSSDLWTNAPNSTLCSKYKDTCSESGTYNASASSSSTFISSDFNISYVDGSGASGNYVKDTIHIGGESISGLQFGVGYTSSSDEGVLGIGYPSLEVQVQRNGKSSYANLPELMKNKGLINSNAYSLWLNDLDASTGNILFGGVNTEKYHGELETLPILKEYGKYYEFLIALTAVGISSDSENATITNSSEIAALLDSGTTLTYLPNAIADVIIDAVGAEFSDSDEVAYVSCDLADVNATVDFTFSSPTISVPMDELVLDYGTTVTGDSTKFSEGESVCLFGIARSGDSTAVMGDTFLRSAYVVYDIDNNEISLGQTKFNSTSNNIKEITSGEDGVPDSEHVTNAVSVLSTATATGSVSSITQLVSGTDSDKDSGSATTSSSMAAIFGAFAIGFMSLL